MKGGSFFKDTMNTLTRNSAILRELTTEEQCALKECMLEIFQDVYRVCQKHGLVVMLAEGTVLGCVRHKGYIPWDDDLDIVMPRRDFELLKGVFKKELGDRYILCAPNYEGKAKTRFPKIFKKGTEMKELTDINSDLPCGVYLDVFLLDNIPQNKFVQTVKGHWCDVLMKTATCVYWYEHRCAEIKEYMCKSRTGKMLYYFQTVVGGACHVIMPSWKWFNWVDKAIRCHKETGLMGITTGRKHYFGEILPTEVFLPVSCGIFEGVEVPLPGDCDKYLKNLYGDYMQIPPPEKRERHLVVSLKL